MSRKKTTEQFITEARAVHESKYDYSKAVYASARDKIEIICPEHGSFWQSTGHHLAGRGCPRCTGAAIRKGRGFDKITFNEARAREKHGDKYDYSNARWEGSKSKVKIICPEHGPFMQAPDKHYAGGGCPECGKRCVAEAKRLSTESFILKAGQVHGKKYTYTKSIYLDSITTLVITCPEHGDFEQQPANHLGGKGCKNCADIRTGDSQRNNVADFIDAAYLKHGDKYDYSKVIYKNLNDKVIITCPKHGDFAQCCNNHISQGSDCPKCASGYGPSKPEVELFDFVKALCPDAVQSDRNVLSGKEIDILIPSLNIGVEFNGIYYHSTMFNPDLFYHQKKTDQAREKGVRLIHIWSDEWLEKPELIKGYLRRILAGASRKVGARQCEIVSTTGAEQRDFLNANHLQGVGRGGSGFALRYQGEVLAVALVIGNELARWCVKLDTDIVGGFSRVMRRFKSGLFSYCDTAKHTGEGYLKSGWKEVDRRNIPQTFYVKGQQRISRQAGVLLAGGMGKAQIEAAGLLRLNGCRQLKFQITK